MKIGEMNANLLKQLRHKKITKDIKSPVRHIGQSYLY